jgi:hypothetical protein
LFFCQQDPLSQSDANLCSCFWESDLAVLSQKMGKKIKSKKLARRIFKQSSPAEKKPPRWTA